MGWKLPGLTTLALGMLPAALGAQVRIDTVVAGAHYDVSGFVRMLAGSNWRDVWAAPIAVPVLDLRSYAGGIVPFKAGGNQSKTLRFHGADGKTYVFRSTDKDTHNALPEDLSNTPVGAVIQDQSSAFHPTAHLAVAVFQERLGILQAVPTLYIMPDDARLGEFRKDFAGKLGQMELRPEEAENSDRVSFGAEAIDGSDKVLEELEESLDREIDTREFLTARLIDFLINDTDRGADQWRWARFDHGDYDTYRPIPRDRDYSFMNANSFIVSLARSSLPKVQAFKTTMPKVSALTFMTREFDRSVFAGLPWSTWDSVVSAITNTLDDATIREAVSRTPPGHFKVNGEEVIETLKARRVGLRAHAWEFYTMVSREVDVFASKEDDMALVDRHADGSVTVRLYSEDEVKKPLDARRAAFNRTFIPAETKEIRVYMDKGDDHVIVRGGAAKSIKLRVVGGGGDDMLVDSSRVADGGGVTVFYDAHGKNQFVRGAGTTVNEKEYYTYQPKKERESKFEDEDCHGDGKDDKVCQERRGRFQDLMNTGKGFVEEKLKGGSRNWGGSTGLAPAAGWADGTGALLGLSRRAVGYGFRHDPYNTKYTLTALYGPGNSRFGAYFDAEVRPENSMITYAVTARATRLASDRFPGFGNDTPLLDSETMLVRRDEYFVHPTVRLNVGSARWFALGPVVRYIKADPQAGSPAALLLPDAQEPYGQVGGQFDLNFDGRDDPSYPTKGYTLRGAASFFPETWDVPTAYSSTHLQATAYLPLGGPVIALRAGGAKVFGDAFPLHDAANLGGSQSVRGYRGERFVGDAEAHGSVELRLPLGRITLLTRGTIGVFGLADAGRLWYQGESPGGWHTGFGGGLSFYTLGTALSVAYARGEQGRFYVKLGMPY